MNKIEKTAIKDAQRWAAAEMFYGPGAGTRRKLLNAEIEQRMVELGGTDYTELFNIAYENLDMNQFAQMAIKERKHLDRIAKAHQNVRAFKSGNMGNLTNGIAVAVGVYIILNKTGYDKVIEKEVKVQYQRAKTEIKIWKARREGRNVEKIA